jgi:hypothetical protein
MSDTYTKLFSSITESTVWGEPYATRIVWVAMLAMADARGNVYGSLPGLARRANVTLEEVERALASFSAPDPYSRARDEDGRRVEKIDGGWHLINHGKYGAIRGVDERREYKREWDRHNRSKAAKSEGTPDSNSDAPDENPTNPTGATPPALAPTPVDQDLTTPDEVVVAGKPAAPTCPHSEIVALYHEVLPELARVRDWTGDRQAFLRTRWREKPERQTLGWWLEYFGYVRTCPWLMGQGVTSDDRAPFFADLEWLVRPKNFRKVIEGKYEQRRAA